MDIEKLDLESMNIVELQKSRLKEIFPEVFTEGDKIDYERLKLTLGEVVDTGKERYGMNWPGKAECYKTIQYPSLATLVPCPEESVDFDNTGNLFIEGDNLEVLKLLQKSYLGKIKMIYIDPPYNTGNDFIYPDNYTESLETYLSYTGQIDAEGRKFSTNTETEGRFHSKWLNMMYPRLFLARNLLRDDGVIFISIDDNEVDNLKKICNEIFGEENFVECFIWRSRQGKGSTSEITATLHEYVLSYSKNIQSVNFLGDIRVKDSGSKERLRQWGQGDKREDRPTMYYGVVSEEFGEVFPVKPDGSEGRWRLSKSRFDDLIRNNLVIFEKQKDGRVEAYKIIPEGTQTETAQDSILNTESIKTTAHGTKEIIGIFNNKIYDYPKPRTLIKHFIKISFDEGIILDFFAGSCTTAHAVLDLNKEDNGNRKFICVQLPEPTDPNSEAYKAGYKYITEIGKERIRRVIKKINDENKDKLKFEENRLDLGFKVFKLAPSNIRVWRGQAAGKEAEVERLLIDHVEHLSTISREEAILYEILLKCGFELSAGIDKMTLAGNVVYNIEDGALLVCLEKNITKELIRAIAEIKPARCVILDRGFHNDDQLKTNAVQTMKDNGVEFRTV